MIPFLVLVWAEVAGKREKWERRLERERGQTGSGDYPANGAVSDESEGGRRLPVSRRVF